MHINQQKKCDFYWAIVNKQNCLTILGAHKLIFVNYITDSDLQTDRKTLLLTTKNTKM
jgi:hypothetical protein